MAKSGEQLFHAGDKIRLRSLKWKMEMIAHEHPGMNLPAMVRTDLAEPKQKRLAVVGGHKSGIAVDGAEVGDLRLAPVLALDASMRPRR